MCSYFSLSGARIPSHVAHSGPSAKAFLPSPVRRHGRRLPVHQVSVPQVTPARFHVLVALIAIALADSVLSATLTVGL
jgi:hypothetical protein